MPTTTTTVPVDLIYRLEPLIHDLADGKTDSTSMHAFDAELADLPDPVRRGELASFVAGVGALTPGEQHGLAGALDRVQLDSKRWLIDNLQAHCDLEGSSLVILGGWYGVLPLLINWLVPRPPHSMLAIDIDPLVVDAGARLIGARYANVGYRTSDVMTLDYDEIAAKPGAVVVNTICEHLPDLDTWWTRIPTGQLVVAQSNNYFPVRTT